jgi:hypothetical protein
LRQGILLDEMGIGPHGQEIDHYDDDEQAIPFDYEIAIVDGERGRRLAIEQANAILEVLEWIGRPIPPTR